MTEKVQISMPREIKKELDGYIRQLDMNRSKFFLVAAYKYLEELRKQEMREKLVEGYTAINNKSVEIIRSARILQAKTLKGE